MKKILLPFLLFALIFVGGHTAFAQAAACPTGSDKECPGNQICNVDTKQCVVGLRGGLNSIGDACISDNDCRGSSVECDSNTHVCAYYTASAAAPGGAAGSGNFVPLTNLPIFGNSSTLTSAPSLPAFFNALYLYCVGIAAALAVLQLIHAGILYMGGDSITEVKQAKDLIGSAIFGLLLVLSPYIVFSLINPKILSLNVGFDKLGTTQTTGTVSSGTNVIPATSAADCKNKGGTASGDATSLICTAPTNSAAGAAANACSNFQSQVAVPSAAGTDANHACSVEGGDNYVSVDTSCCSGIQSGYACCALPIDASTKANTTLPLQVTEFIAYGKLGDQTITSNTDLGPISSDWPKFDLYSKACTDANQHLSEKTGSPGKCSAADIQYYTSDPILKKYVGTIGCTPTTFTCGK